MQRCSTGTARDEASGYLTNGFSPVGQRGHRFTERRPPFLGEEQALAVKDADPRASTRTLHIELIMLGKVSMSGAVAAILMIPTALSAQVGGAVSLGVHVGGALELARVIDE